MKKILTFSLILLLSFSLFSNLIYAALWQDFLDSLRLRITKTITSITTTSTITKTASTPIYVTLPSVSNTWNKNPNFDNYEGVDITFSDTSRTYNKFDWGLQWNVWTDPANSRREGRGNGKWYKDGTLYLAAIFGYTDPSRGNGQILVASAGQSAERLPMGAYKNVMLNARHKLNTVHCYRAFCQGIIDIWFRVPSTYNGVTKERTVLVDYYWYTTNPLPPANERIDNEILVAARYGPGLRNSHSNWRDLTVDLTDVIKHAQEVGENYGFYFDWRDAYLTSIQDLAEVYVVSLLGFSGTEVQTQGGIVLADIMGITLDHLSVEYPPPTSTTTTTSTSTTTTTIGNQCGDDCEYDEIPICCCRDTWEGTMYWMENKCPEGSRYQKENPEWCAGWTTCNECCSSHGYSDGTIKDDACCCDLITTTSTSTSTSTSIPPSKCTTSDPPYCDYSGYPCGDNAKLKGKTTLKDGRTQDDTCIDTRWLKEYYCKTPDDTTFNYKNIDCRDYGSTYICYYGRCISGGGGGCPILKAWDGKDFVEIETLGIHSEEGVDTIVETSFSMEAIDGKYKLLLTEASYLQWEGSHIDSVKLTDETGKECRLISAEHSKEGDVISAISNSDDVRIETKPTEEIALTFEGCSGNEFIFSIEGYNRFLVKLGSTETDIVLIMIAIITVVVIVFGVFKYFINRS